MGLTCIEMQVHLCGMLHSTVCSDLELALGYIYIYMRHFIYAVSLIPFTP
jgi:hypothetical protein